MTIEQQNQRIQRTNKRLTVALTMAANKRLTAALAVMAVILATGCGSKGVTSESDGLPSTLVGNWAFSRDGNYQGREEYNSDGTGNRWWFKSTLLGAQEDWAGVFAWDVSENVVTLNFVESGRSERFSVNTVNQNTFGVTYLNSSGNETSNKFTYTRLKQGARIGD
jgi:hypothetical protein